MKIKINLKVGQIENNYVLIDFFLRNHPAGRSHGQ